MEFCQTKQFLLWVLRKQPLGILLNKTIFTMNALETTFFVMAVHAQEYVVLMDAANRTTIFIIESWRSYESRYTKQQQCRTKTTTRGLSKQTEHE